MYDINWPMILRRTRVADASRPGPGLPPSVQPSLSRIPRIVWALGATSLLTDLSSEMVSSILPVYLLLYLHVSPLTVGLVDGLYQGFGAVARIATAVIADRRIGHKYVATAGYALSALCRLALPAVGSSWPGISAVIAVDRTGKGIRTAPRDAMISLSSEPQHLGLAFGVHRAMDAVGAILGPVVAFVLLTRTPPAFDILFAISFGVAILGLGALVLFVPAQPLTGNARPPGAASSGLIVLLRRPRFVRLLLAAAGLSLVTVSDSLLFLSLQQQLKFSVGFFPLFFVASSAVTCVFAIAGGRLADRFGRAVVFLAGYMALAVLYAAMLYPPVAGARVILAPILIGAYYAATDGVLPAMASSVLPSHLRASGLALLGTAVSGARLVSSFMMGVAWQQWGMNVAMTIFLASLGIAIGFACVALRRGNPGSLHEDAVN